MDISHRRKANVRTDVKHREERDLLTWRGRERERERGVGGGGLEYSVNHGSSPITDGGNVPFGSGDGTLCLRKATSQLCQLENSLNLGRRFLINKTTPAGDEEMNREKCWPHYHFAASQW